jgi:CMP-N-acetylneuraminic acid synthetase
MKTPHPGGDVRTLAIIPARGGSKGIPRKNIADLCGHPLIWYSIREAHAARSIDATIVSTDDEEIARIARASGADVPFLRPAHLADAGARDIGFLQHALEWVERERGWHPEVLVYLPPTTPSRTALDIDHALETMSATGADSVRTMIVPEHVNPYKMWVESGDDGRVEALFPEGRQGIPRQHFPQRWYMPVGAVYATKVSCIKEGRLWGDDVRCVPFPGERYIDIDRPEDLVTAAKIMQDHGLV